MIISSVGILLLNLCFYLTQSFFYTSAHSYCKFNSYYSMIIDNDIREVQYKKCPAADGVRAVFTIPACPARSEKRKYWHCRFQYGLDTGKNAMTGTSETLGMPRG